VFAFLCIEMTYPILLQFFEHSCKIMIIGNSVLWLVINLVYNYFPGLSGSTKKLDKPNESRWNVILHSLWQMLYINAWFILALVHFICDQVENTRRKVNSLSPPPPLTHSFYFGGGGGDYSFSLFLVILFQNIILNWRL
jgi:hypothetical protein